MVVNALMYIFGFTQLSSIHLGHDRNFTMLMYNEKNTRVRNKIKYLTIFKAKKNFRSDRR